MTKAEHERTIEILERWTKNCESFYEHFDDVFKTRADAILELMARIDSVTSINEYLFCYGFISTEKYLEVFDRMDTVFKKLRKLFNIKYKTQKEKIKFKTVENGAKSCFDCKHKRSLIGSKQDWCLCTGRRVNELVGCGLWEEINDCRESN